MTDLVLDSADSALARRKWIVYGGRVVLAATLILAWEWGARAFGTLFFAPPLDVLKRLFALAHSGAMFTDIVATLRVSAAGFAIAAAAGVALPFLLRHSPR